MLQRSPSYVLSAAVARRRSPTGCAAGSATERAYAIVRAQEHRRQQARVYCAVPAASRGRCAGSSAASRPSSCRRDCDVDMHFNPAYDPWDQRLCAVPDGDLFRRLRKGHGVGRHRPDRDLHRARASGCAPARELDADVVVTATGLNLLAFGGIELDVDGESVSLPETLAYKGMMLGGVPNFAFAIGYTNSSWTLKVDLVCEYLCRLLAHMDAARLRRGRAREPTRRHADAAAARLPGRLRPALARPAAQAGRAARRGTSLMATARTSSTCAAARSTTARCASSPRRRAAVGEPAVAA